MRYLRASLSLTFLAAFLLTSAPLAMAEPLDFDIPHGHFFKQANGRGGAGDLGYSVIDDTAPFWSEFQRLGGVPVLGYPVTRRFSWDGFLVQGFQKAVFQLVLETGQVQFVNVFDRLSAAGKDGWLEVVKSIPPSFDNSADHGLPWDEVVKRHLALLDANPAIKAKYLADSDPILHYGLPMSYKDYGAVFVVRAQRAAFQQWKTDVPWAKAGEVVIANGGDVVKEAGILPIVAPVPDAMERTATVSVLAGPGRLYVLQKSWNVLDSGQSVNYRAQLVYSDDFGQSWHPFAGGLPVDAECVTTAGMDYAVRDALYASTCQGIFRWTGTQWESVSSRQTGQVAVEYGNPQNLWTTEAGRIIFSKDGGQSWSNARFPENADTVGIDPRNPHNLYALSVVKGWWFSLWRGTGEPGQWTPLPAPRGPNAIDASMTIDGATGAIYLFARDTSLNSGLAGFKQVWRTSNPDALNVNDIRWELVQNLDPGTDGHLFSTGPGPTGLSLYATLGYYPGVGLPGSWYNEWGDDPLLIRSFDGGKTWEPLVIPSQATGQ